MVLFLAHLAELIVQPVKSCLCGYVSACVLTRTLDISSACPFGQYTHGLVPLFEQFPHTFSST